MPVESNQPGDTLALVLGGGGARGAYQAGVLRGLARRFPNLQIPILTGISAGAINTIHLASAAGSFERATEELVSLWLRITPERVYDLRAMPVILNVLRWGLRLVSGGAPRDREPTRGLMETEPLRQFLNAHLERSSDGSLPGIASNLASGRLRAVALSATSYASGDSVTWVQAAAAELWQRPQRRSEQTRLTVEHAMASSAVPLLFPAVRVGNEWFGDGGVRLIAPLSPALHLGATRILTVSARHRPPGNAADGARVAGYPPPAQILGILYRSVFLDLLDEDLVRSRTVNRLLEGLPVGHRQGMRPVEILALRPSRDLAALAREFEPRLPPLFRYMTRGLGTMRSASPDFLSLILFQTDYLRRLVELGEADAEAQRESIGQFLERT
jgi:NTE family protein